MLDRLSLSLKLALLLACVAVPAIAASGWGLWRLAHAHDELEAIAARELPLTRSIAEVAHQQHRRRRLLERALANAARASGPTTRATLRIARQVELERSSAKLTRELARVEALLGAVDAQGAGHTQVAEELRALRSELEAWEPHARALLASLAAQPAPEAAAPRAHVAAALAPADALDARISASLTQLARLSADSAERSRRRETLALQGAAVLLLFGLGLGGFAGRRVAASVIASLREARKLAQRVENGVPLVGEPSQAGDELGELLRTLNRTGHAVVAAQRSLEASEARNRAIVSGASEGILTLDATGRILTCNAAAGRIAGRPLDEIVGEPLAHLVAPLSEPAAFLCELVGALDETLSTTLERPDGSRVHIEYRASELRYDGPLSYVLLARDLTDRHEVERVKDEFISTVSHELRTPLTAIRGSLGLVEGGVVGELPDETREMIGIARSNCDRLIRLINDILDLEKLESGRRALVSEVVSAESLLGDTVDTLTGLAEERDVRLELQLAEAGLATLGSRDELVQVLVNLASNAISFTQPKGAVVLRARRNDAALRCEVQDRGPGISAADIERIFDRFQQADGSDARRRGGTGLGLAIAKAIVERHGGEIGIESELGVGSVFWFQVPAQPRVEAKPEPPSSLPRMLVVEDDRDLSRVIAATLEARGFAVDPVYGLEEARARLREARPDVVMVDVELPDGNGLDLLAELRAAPETSQVPAIVVSGRAQDGTLGEPRIFDWIEKPFQSDALVESVRRAIGALAPDPARRGEEAKRVLLVEDDADTRRVLHALLERAGFACTEAPDGASALASALAEPPDLIVLDVGLPDLDGFSIVDVLRRGRARATPLLVYSGHDLGLPELDRLRLGLTRHLVKSRSGADEFIDTVQALVGTFAPPPATDPEEATT